MSISSRQGDPKIFIGQRPLATKEDITKLSAEVRDWLTGPSGELSENGYVPLNPSGTIDRQYLDTIGVNIYKDSGLIEKNVTTVNFVGNYVKIQKTDEGKASIRIGYPEDASHWNTIDGNNNGTVIHDIPLSSMIIPDASTVNNYNLKVYGDWVPGSVKPGFNYTTQHQCPRDLFITFTTKDPITFANNYNTYFIINVYDHNKNVIITAQSQVITGNNLNVPLAGNNRNIVLRIDGFTENVGFGELSYVATPTFVFNIGEILGVVGGRFSIEIIHKNDLLTHVYHSEDMFLNAGKLPTTLNPFVQLVEQLPDNTNYSVKYKWCSGLKYINSGKLNYSLQNIDNLNYAAATEEKVLLSSDLISEYKYDETDLRFYTLDLLQNGVKWGKSFDILPNLLRFTPSFVSGTVNNAYGFTEFNSDIYALINTQTLEESSNLIETFADETTRLRSDFLFDYTGTNYERWDSAKSLLEEDEGRGLMIIPGFGLCYPFGNYLNYLPKGQIANYDTVNGIKYYCRRFVGDNKLKFGGTFVLGNITKEEFLHTGITMEISKDNGVTWLDCKALRDGKNPNGVLVDLRDSEEGLLVQFAFINYEYAQGNVGLLFKLGFNSNVSSRITKIMLRNTTNTGAW